MFKAFLALSFALYLLVLPGALAGPSCARRNRNKQSCMSLCAQRWGWPGNVMGNDPWGAVISSKGSSPSDALSTACGGGNSGSDSNGALGSGPGNTDTSTGIVSTSLSSSLPSSSSVSPSTLVVTPSFSTSITKASPSSTTPSSTVADLPDDLTSSSVVASSTPVILPPSPPPSSSSPSPPKETVKPSPAVVQQLAAPSPSSSQASQPQQNTDGSDVQQMLQLHNSLRAQHGAGALSWSNNLAAKAQQWANGCVFKHSGGSLGPFGENLASGTGSEYGVSDAFSAWADEASSYNSGNPQPSHFTQIVWKATTQVGCALATCAPGSLFASSFGSSKYYVCEYQAQGNVIGAFGTNVQA